MHHPTPRTSNSLFPATLQAVLLATAFFFSGPSWSQSNRDWVMEQTRRLAPDEYEILKRCKELPEVLSVRTGEGGTRMTSHNGDVYAYLESEDRTGLLGDMDTNIHEINHGLTNAWAFYHAQRAGKTVPDRYLYYYYVKPGEEHFITSSIPFFPSARLIPGISPELRTFRFDTYVDGNSSTQNHGLLGLLDEYNAYFHSLKVSWQLKQAYLETTQDPARGYLDWINSLTSVGQAYYEFRFFIFEYLHYARANDPEVYRAVRNDPRLSQAFNSISRNYKEYVDAMHRELSSGWQTYAAQHGLEREESNGVIFLGTSDGSMRGFRKNLEDAEKLRPVLQSSRYAEVRRETAFE